MRELAKHVVSIRDGERKFLVTFNENDKPLAIKERRLHAPGTFYECWFNASIWHHSQGPATPDSRPGSLIEKARKKLHERRSSGH